MNRREILAGLGATVGLSGCQSSQTKPQSCEVACFEFEYEGWDDAPNWLTIRHVRGRNLPANEVFITDVVVEHGPETWVVETVAWHEVDTSVGPTDGIGSESVRVNLDHVSTAQVLWRHEDDEQELAEWSYE